MKFSDALKESVKHLRSPEFHERVVSEDERMLSEIDILVKINQKGFLTFNSQSGRSINKRIDNKPYRYIERSYIMGFMLKTEAEKFMHHMHMNTDKMVLLVPYCRGKDSERFYDERQYDVPLTVEYFDGKEKVHTHMSVAIPRAYMEQEMKHAKINKSEPVEMIFCFDPKWNRYSSSKNGLFTQVLAAL